MKFFQNYIKIMNICTILNTFRKFIKRFKSLLNLWRKFSNYLQKKTDFYSIIEIFKTFIKTAAKVNGILINLLKFNKNRQKPL